MSVTSWLHSQLNRRQNRHVGVKARRMKSILCFQRLEDRTVPSTVVWDGGTTGNGTDWLVAANWVGDQLPGTGDDVLIGNSGSNPMISVGGITEVKSVLSERAIAVSGNLTVNGTTADFK